MQGSTSISKFFFLAFSFFVYGCLADVLQLMPAQRNCLSSFSSNTLPLSIDSKANLYSYQVTKDSDIILISISSSAADGFSRGISILAAQSLETLIDLLNYNSFHTQHQPFEHTISCDFSYGDSCILNFNEKAMQKETIYLALVSNISNHQLCFFIQEKESVTLQLEQQIQVIQSEASAFVAIQSSQETVVRFNNIAESSGIGQVEIYLLHKDGSIFRDLGGLTDSNVALYNHSNEPIELLAIESAFQNKLLVSQFHLNKQTTSIIIRILNAQVYSELNTAAISIRFMTILSHKPRIIQPSQTNVVMLSQYFNEDILAFDYILKPAKGNHFVGYEEVIYNFEIEGLELQSDIKSLKGSFSTKELGIVQTFTSQTQFSLDVQYHNSQGFSSFGRVQLVLSFDEVIPANKPIIFMLSFTTQSNPVNQMEEKEQTDHYWEIIGIVATCGLFILVISGIYIYIKRKQNEGRVLMKNEEQVEEITEDIKIEGQNNAQNNNIPNRNEFNVNDPEKDQKSKKKPLSTKSSTKTNGEHIELQEKEDFQKPKLIYLEMEQNTERKLKSDTAQNTNRDCSKNNIDNSQNLHESICHNPNNEENIFNNLLQSSNIQKNTKTLRFKANKEHLRISIEENPKKKKTATAQQQPNLVLPPKKALSNHKSDENVNNHSI